MTLAEEGRRDGAEAPRTLSLRGQEDFCLGKRNERYLLSNSDTWVLQVVEKWVLVCMSALEATSLFRRRLKLSQLEIIMTVEARRTVSAAALAEAVIFRLGLSHGPRVVAMACAVSVDIRLQLPSIQLSVDHLYVKNRI